MKISEIEFIWLTCRATPSTCHEACYGKEEGRKKKERGGMSFLDNRDLPGEL